MTRFEKDYNAIQNDEFAAIEILEGRKAQLAKLENEGKTCKNGFRRTCIAQEYARLNNEYKALEELL